MDNNKDLEEIKTMIKNQKQLAKDQALKITELRLSLSATECNYNQLKQDYTHLKNDHKLVNTCWCLIGLMVGIITGVML